ncbi:hypothetical protein PYW08_009564 [Mythimna loreyi]|uniref:Uncharacterized protein n=1 Tax=Mythimna loreyi TaxID=667449 RepID=A0ACC2QB81_9NEOP|nr:hypothetical protein PYW08_009564 [Mythimna loreyi]
MEKQEIPKRKKKIIKRHKKKIRSKHEKHEHILHEHIPHEKHELQEHLLREQDQQEHIPNEQKIEKIVEASVEQDKVDYAQTTQTAQKVLRNYHKKRGKVQDNPRKFFKVDQRESNSSESEEVKRRKPVDIIVHIKMNE